MQKEKNNGEQPSKKQLLKQVKRLTKKVGELNHELEFYQQQAITQIEKGEARIYFLHMCLMYCANPGNEVGPDDREKMMMIMESII